jgi:hypothetical protein
MKKSPRTALRALAIFAALALPASALTLLPVAVAGATGVDTLTLSGTPVTSASGNSYTVSLDAPTDVAPVDPATVTDSNIYSVSNSCVTNGWTDEGTDGNGGELFDASCAITTSESGGDTVQATYAGLDYTVPPSNTLTVGSVNGTITISGNPVTSATGNTFDLTMDVPTDVNPNYAALVLDSGSGGCSGSNWSAAGPDGSGGYLFTSTCTDVAPESGGEVVTPYYSGGDYTLIDTNTITIGSAPANLTLAGDPTNPGASTDGNEYEVTLIASTDVYPTGTVTVTDSNSNYCSTPNWIDNGSDGIGGEFFVASCALDAAEAAGVAVTASYAGADYTSAPSNQLTVSASALITLAGDPVTSFTGNTYGITFDASTTTPPTGVATVSDSGAGNGPQYCGTDTWTAVEPDGLGGEIFTGTCTISAPEIAGETVSVSYDDSDYIASQTNNLTVGAAPATLALSGSPVTSANGNSYIVTLDSPTDVTPNGTTFVTDSGVGACQTSDWIDAGPDGNGGELFSASCVIAQSEAGPATVSATYSGIDYITSTSNTLTVAPASATLTISGTPIAGTNNEYAVMLDASTDVPPTGTVTVTDSGANSYATSSWAYHGGDGSGGAYFIADAVIAEDEPLATTVSASYAGPDYTAATSNTLIVTTAPAGIGTATISGTPAVGDTLTAAATGVTGAPTATPSYQWYDNGNAITNATNATYVVATGDQGMAVTVTIIETNGIGTPATATSSAVNVPAATPPSTPPATTTTTTTTTPAAPPATFPVSDYSSLTTVSVGGASASVLTVPGNSYSLGVDVPANALPAGTSLSFYSIDTAAVAAALAADTPSGQTVVLPLAVSWQDNGVSATATAPIVITITDSSIAIGDHVYVLSPSGATLEATATAAGTITFSITSDPVFLVTAPIAKTAITVPAPVTIGFAPKTSSLGTPARVVLRVLAKKIAAGDTVSVTGYAKDNLALAKKRTKAVADFFATLDITHVTLHYSTASANKVVIATK